MLLRYTNMLLLSVVIHMIVACLSHTSVDLRVIPRLIMDQAWTKVTIKLAFIPPLDLVSGVIL